MTDEDPEPTRNISGGNAGGGTQAAFAPGEADTRAEAVIDRLGDLYWQKTYGGRDAFECLVRTILSQNTSDVASQPAHDALLERYAEPGDESDLAETLAEADVSHLAETIESAGLYNQKAERIVAAAEWVCETYGDVVAFDEWVTNADVACVRDRLLGLTGVGPKTADCVLLFAGGQHGVLPVKTPCSYRLTILKSAV